MGMSRQAVKGSGCGANLCCRWSGGRWVSYSRVQTEHGRRNKATPRQKTKGTEVFVCFKQTGSSDMSPRIKGRVCVPFFKWPRSNATQWALLFSLTSCMSLKELPRNALIKTLQELSFQWFCNLEGKNRLLSVHPRAHVVHMKHGK